MTSNSSLANQAASTHEPMHGSWHASAMTLYVTFGLLMLLLATTVLLAEQLSGKVGTTVNLSISVMKTALIVAIFMNLRGSPPSMRLAAFAALLWLSFALIFVLGDVISRGWQVDEPHDLQENFQEASDVRAD